MPSTPRSKPNWPNFKRQLLGFAKKNWLTIVLALMAPFLTWYFFVRGSLELTATVLVDVPVVSVREEYGDDIEFRYKGESVDGLRVVEVEIANTGSRPLERSAFDSPVTFAIASGRFTKPIILNTRPKSLTPQLKASGSIVTLDPLLLNPRDSFVFRVFIVGGNESQSITATGRVRGVSEIDLRRPYYLERQWLEVVGIVNQILILVSMIPVAILLRRLLRGTVRLPLDHVVALADRLDTDPGIATKASQLAQELDISRHDSKANLPFLRLRIESSLRDLARRADLPRRDQLGSVRGLSERLVHDGLIPGEIWAAIKDISPSLNRKLREIESYLSDEEFSSLQRLSLNVIAALSIAIDKHTARREAT